MPITEQKLVLTRTYCSDRKTTVAIAACVHVVVIRREVEVPCVSRVTRTEQTRPVVAEAAHGVKATIAAITSCGQEDTIAVTSGEQPAVHTVLCCPSHCCVLVQLHPIIISGHAPSITPIGCGCIVLRQQNGKAIGKTVVTITGVVTILGKRVVAAVAILVGAPIICVLGLGLTPSKVCAIILRSTSTHVAGGL